MLSLFKVFMSPDVIEPVNEVLMSGYITQGPKVEEFEAALKDMFDYPYIVTLNSATSGLTLAMRMIMDRLGFEKGDEVLSTPLTCMATNLPILANNLDIKWVDVNKETGLIDLGDLERKITKKTKIITFVHWGGQPVDLDEVKAIIDRKEAEIGFRPYVLEDCAHAFLSEYKGRKLGTHGNFAVFSTQAIKHLTTGDGGLIFCPDEEFYERAKLLRWYGIDRNKRNYKGKDFRLEHDVEHWGYKFHMNDINATLGLFNLPHMPSLVAKNKENAKYLCEGLKDMSGVKVLSSPDDPDYQSSFWLFTILVERKLEFISYMKEQGIMVSQVHQRNDVHTCFKDFRVELPNLNEVEKKIVCIPVGWWIERSDLERMVEAIGDFV